MCLDKCKRVGNVGKGSGVGIRPSLQGVSGVDLS